MLETGKGFDWATAEALAFGSLIAKTNHTLGTLNARSDQLSTAMTETSQLLRQIEDKNQQQMLAYRELPDEDLFSEQWVHVPMHARELPGYKSARIACAVCGEGINYDRQTEINGQIICQGCADPTSRYYQPLATPAQPANK